MKDINIFISFTDRSDENIVRYFGDITKYKLLNAEEEKDLARKIQNGDEQAFNKLVLSNLRFVITVAKQYQGRGISLIDLINEGNIGLCKAAREFNPDAGVRFITYAVWWIKNVIVNAIYVKSGHIYMPIAQSVKINRYNKAVKYLSGKLNRDPDIEDIADYMEISEAEVKQIILLKQHYNSIDENHGTEDEPLTLENLIPSKFNSDEEFLKKDKIIGLNLIISSIPDNRSADIVRTMFGIGTRSLTLEELASRFNMSSERVRQLKESGIEWLKKNKSNILKEYI